MLFDKGHAFFRPKDSGLFFGSLTDEELRKLSPALTESEQQYPHASYFSKEISLPEEFQETLKNGPMDPALAFMPEDYGKFMNTEGHCEVENGYCVLPNGVTYAAVLLRQEGRTDETVRYYNDYFAPEENLFYKTWCPGFHYLHYADGAFEDFGFGRMNMKFAHDKQASEMGLDPKLIEKNDPACIGIGGTATLGFNLDSADPKKPQWNTIAFYHRQTSYGREVRVRLWYGYGWENNKPVFTPPEPKQALDIARLTMKHVMMEYSNDQYLETKFWDDTH